MTKRKNIYSCVYMGNKHKSSLQTSNFTIKLVDKNYIFFYAPMVYISWYNIRLSIP